jgi:T5orf172 domain
MVLFSDLSYSICMTEIVNFSPPSPNVYAELASFLEHDETLLGEIYRKKRDGISNDEIQKAQGAAYPNFIWNYQRQIRSLLEGDIAKKISVLNETAVHFRRALKFAGISNDTKVYLNLGLQEIEERKSDSGLVEKTTKQALKSSDALEKSFIPGIYVYSLMHYLNYPYHPESGRTLMKVGKSDRDVITRFREQTRTTALPEEPVLLRIYENVNSGSGLTEVEKIFHSLLEAADHDRSTARTGGTEWFLSSLKFLDKVADTLKMKITCNAESDSEEFR